MQNTAPCSVLVSGVPQNHCFRLLPVGKSTFKRREKERGTWVDQQLSGCPRLRVWPQGPGIESCIRLLTGSLMWDTIPGPWGHTLSRRQMLNHWATQMPLPILLGRPVINKKEKFPHICPFMTSSSFSSQQQQKYIYFFFFVDSWMLQHCDRRVLTQSLPWKMKYCRFCYASISI